MKTRLLSVLAMLLPFVCSHAAPSLSDLGKLELFVNHKKVPVSLPQDAKLYDLFGKVVFSSSIIQHLSGGVDKEEIDRALRSKTRLVYTASKPFAQRNSYGQKIVCKRIIVTLPTNHLPLIVVEGPDKTYDLSGYSLPALEALTAYPKINKSNLPQYQQLKPWNPKTQPKKET